MKKIRNGLYLMVIMLILLFPIQTAAAGQDGVFLEQEGESVAVALEMGNAQQEKISAVAVSLQIDEGSRDKVKAEFNFAGELGGAEKGYLYNETTGVLDIYAASAQSLFAEDILNLGYVHVTSKESGEILPVEISYIEASFQTANEIYGEKRPMVSRTPEPVKMQVGEGSANPGDSGDGDVNDGTNPGDGAGSDVNDGTNPGDSIGSDVNDGANSGNPGGSNVNGGTSQGGTSGSGDGNSGNNPSGSDNMDQGLNDEKTQFVNDPASAEKITSSVIKGSETHTELVDMSKQTSTSIGGTVRPGGGRTPKLSRPENKVSVVSPEKGPASIFVAKGVEGSYDDTQGKESIEGQPEDTEGVLGDVGEDLSDQEEGTEGEEILLDQKDGGVKTDSSEKRNRILKVAGIAIALVVCVGLGVFGVVKANGILVPKKRRKPVRKKGKKQVRKRKKKKQRAARSVK